jgi:hypothetical protein
MYLGFGTLIIISIFISVIIHNTFVLPVKNNNINFINIIKQNTTLISPITKIDIFFQKNMINNKEIYNHLKSDLNNYIDENKANMNHTDSYYYNFIGIYNILEIQDIDMGIYYINISANMNNTFANYNLGILYFYNKNNIDLSRKYFLKSIELKYSIAMSRYGRINYYLKDYEKMHYYYNMAIMNNDILVNYYYGLFYKTNKFYNRTLTVKYYNNFIKLTIDTKDNYLINIRNIIINDLFPKMNLPL